jgi:hypothetical protein
MNTQNGVKGESKAAGATTQQTREYRRPEVHHLGSLEKVLGLFSYGPLDFDNRRGIYPVPGSAV